jgi:hypothetical protein
MHRVSLLLLTLGGLVLSGLVFICYGFHMTKEESVPLTKEIHAQIHAVVESPLLAQEDLENPVAGLETISGSLAKMEARVDSCLPRETTHSRTLLLEQTIIHRLRELIQHRKSCEKSLQSALHDTLFPNPLAGPVETTIKPPPPSKDGYVSQTQIYLSELNAENQQRIKEDTVRRRTLFAQGAKARWKEARQRIQTQVRQDLRKLDALIATSVL